MKRMACTLAMLMGFSAVANDGSVYGMGGIGRASDGNSTGYQGGQYGYEYKTGQNSRVGVMYYNEGTPENNHRDGFAVMGWYNQPITKDLSIQAGVGPYYSMNTTTVNGEQLNDKKLGAMAAIAVLYRIYGSHFDLRAQYTHAQVPGAVNTDTLFVGVGYNFTDAREEVVRRNIEASVWGGNSHTTRGGADMVRGFQVEVQKLATPNVAYSVSVIHEGNTGVVDRKGVAGQVWYVTKTENNWTFSVGAGPYIARDDIEDRTKLLGLVSLGASKNVTKTVKVGVRFNRVVTGNHKDQDMFLIGVEKKF
ncbi:outer membrane beta-barrel protein [Bdellovibrio sp. BCCA]|uniref:outer membrane beta-barrel protein n=1 Tax=Bdellovibrio sp. BCCA TaxID=3136281 RepID=UPI0030F101F3